jgi:hypothetical protein
MVHVEVGGNYVDRWWGLSEPEFWLKGKTAGQK